MIQEDFLVADFQIVDEFQCDFNIRSEFDCEFDNGIKNSDYEGSYTVTPTEQTQTLQTTSKLLGQDITINPIPSNYGLITWDGTRLTVS